MKRSILVIGVCLTGIGGWYGIRALLGCQPKLSLLTDVQATDWRAEIWSVECGGYGWNGGLDIRLVNSRTGLSNVLVTGGDINNMVITSPSAGRIDITLPNRSISKTLTPNVPGVEVRYHFIPSDDPEDRKGFLNWYWGDKKTDVNRNWYCDNVFRNIGGNRVVADLAMAYSVYGPDDLRKTYCLKASEIQ